MKKLLLTVAVVLPTIGFGQVDFAKFNSAMDSLDVAYTNHVYDLLVPPPPVTPLTFHEMKKEMKVLEKHYKQDSLAILRKYGYLSSPNNKIKSWK